MSVYVLELITGELLVSKIESQDKNDRGLIVYKLRKPIRLILNPVSKKVEMSTFPIGEVDENSLVEISEDKLLFKPILASEKLYSIYIQSTSNLVIPQANVGSVPPGGTPSQGQFHQ